MSERLTARWKWCMAAADYFARCVMVCLPTALSSLFDCWLLFLAEGLHLLSGRFKARGTELCKRPKELLKLYEYQACHDCALVRETLSVLDIDHCVYPCPMESLKQKNEICLNSRFRTAVIEKNGSLELPFLVDDNTNASMHGSDDICAYLWRVYGSEAVAPWNYRLSSNQLYRSISKPLIELCRPCLHMGWLRAASWKPAKPLEMWGYEGSMFVRRVKEALCTCEIPYIHHVLPFGSQHKRQEFSKDHFDDIGDTRRRLNFIKVPFLRDPNTGKEMFESSAIVDYIQTRYQTTTVPVESWLNSN